MLAATGRQRFELLATKTETARNRGYALELGFECIKFRDLMSSSNEISCHIFDCCHLPLLSRFLHLHNKLHRRCSARTEAAKPFEKSPLRILFPTVHSCFSTSTGPASMRDGPGY